MVNITVLSIYAFVKLNEKIDCLNDDVSSKDNLISNIQST